MASGLPSVVSAISEEQVRDGEEGFVVHDQDPAAYAERLLRLLDDPAVARRMGGRARQRAVEHRDASSSADRLAAFLRSVHRTPPAGEGERLRLPEISPREQVRSAGAP